MAANEAVGSRVESGLSEAVTVSGAANTDRGSMILPGSAPRRCPLIAVQLELFALHYGRPAGRSDSLNFARHLDRRNALCSERVDRLAELPNVSPGLRVATDRAACQVTRNLGSESIQM